MEVGVLCISPALNITNYKELRPPQREEGIKMASECLPGGKEMKRMIAIAALMLTAVTVVAFSALDAETQTVSAAALLLLSSALIMVRSYENSFFPRMGGGILGLLALLLAAGFVGFGWTPSLVFGQMEAVVFIIAAMVGPVLQLMAPDPKTLENIKGLEEDLESSEEDLDAAEATVEGLEKDLQVAKEAVETAKAEAKVTDDKIAKIEGALQASNDALAVAEKTAAEAVEARHAAETAQATAEAVATPLREHAERAEAHAAGVQVRLSAFEERKVADLAAADLAASTANLAAAKQQVVALQGTLQTAEAEQGHLQGAHQDAISGAESAWEAVEEAAKAALTSEAALAEAKQASEAAAKAIENGVKVLDADGLASALSDAEAAHDEASEGLSRLNGEARKADVAIGRLAADLRHAETQVSALTADLDAAEAAQVAARVSADEAAKVAESAEVEAVAAERRFSALVAAERQNTELGVALEAANAEKSALVAQCGELQDAVKDALRASGCVLEPRRLGGDDEVAYYAISLRLPQETEITFAVQIRDDEEEEVLFRTIPVGKTLSEEFEVDRGFNSRIRILPPGQTAEHLGTTEIVPYLVA